MFTMLVSIFIYLAALFVWAVLSAIIGIYVYRDLKKRRMNTLLWTAVGVVLNVPGLIIYMMARKIYFKRKCPACMADTPENVKFCSQCGVELETVRPKLGLVAKTIIGICVAAVVAYIAVHLGIFVTAVITAYQQGGI